MPVLPLVGSMMTRCVPGKRSPLASAWSSIASAMRSLTEPEGLAPSSFAHRRTPGRGLKLGSATRGVLPIARSIDVGVRTASTVIGSAAASDRRQDRDHVALFDTRLEAVQVAHVLVVDVDVDEAPLSAITLQQLSGEARVTLVDVGDQLAQGRTLSGDAALASDSRPQHGRHAYVCHHGSAQRRDRGAAKRLVVDQLVDGRVVAA